MKDEKMIIDGDNMKCLGKFSVNDTEKEVEKYKNAGWGDVSVDVSGDIVLYKDGDEG